MMKACIFDLDNTLYDYDDAHETAFRALSIYARERFGTGAEEFRVLHAAAMSDQVARLGANNAAIHNRLLRYQRMLERLGRSVRYAPEMSACYWSAFLDAVRPYPGAAACFDALQGAGLAVGVGTNMTADYQYAKLDRLGLLDRLDFLVTSEEAGVEKPDGRLFALCAEKAGCPASACVFVGDNPEHDVRGALRAGMSAVWFRPGGGPPEDGLEEIRSLWELPGRVRALEARQTGNPA